MKRTLSLRAMLIGLFLAAVIGAVVLAATGWTTNQRLIDSQRFITGEVLPQQDASRGMILSLGAFGQRHTDLLATDSEAALQGVLPRATLNERFGEARERLSVANDGSQSARLARLDENYQALLDADAALEAVRQEELALQADMATRIAEMQTHIAEVMVSAEDMAGRTMITEVRQRRALLDQIDAWREDGMTSLPTSLLDSLLEDRVDIGQISGEVRTGVALLADMGWQLMQIEDGDALANLRDNEIAQQIDLARQSLRTIIAAPNANSEQVALANALEEVIVELDGLMVGREDAVYALRQQQIALHARMASALTGVEVSMAGLRTALAEVEVHVIEQAELAAIQAEELANAGRILLIVVTLIVIVLLAVFGWRTLVRVLGPLTQMRSQMENISGAAGQSGDLSKRMAISRHDEIGLTAQAFNQMMDSFERIVAQIRDGALGVASSSRQIASGNEDLSQRTEQQSSSLAQTASSLEQITATVKQTAEYATQARELSSGVDLRARSAGEVAERTNLAMSDIRHSSEQITSIVKAIDDIAFQTNLLALNASVEAARAGEQGRGFAVVAGEVRNLAQRSAAEAAQIRKLVQNSVTKVGEGAKLVGSTSDHLKEIVGSLEQVSRFVGDIADATQEQSIGIEQINQAISQLDQVTHQNARLVEEAATSSRVLDERAAEMHDLVGRFKVSDHLAGDSSWQAALPSPGRPALMS
ncbi:MULTISPECIES: methyl-accepting chemotaxis protein [Halomonadaceae]|uniref:methyl-accepting chemotaxis protein n=1 Tax=Halomonadaceae TaxID=28256 RepID=UPI00159A70FE|nr:MULTISPECIES: methyl-accepting chemotaxis protein [Halomonas]QJQ96305.1 HAMP domain-containing protein [Halomonas sp. PA5]